MGRSRSANVEWDLASDQGLHLDSLMYQHIQCQLLMDIRQDLRDVKNVVGCHNFIDVPNILRGVRRNTAKPRKPK